MNYESRKIGIKNGFGMIEIVIGVAIISVFLFSVMNAARLSLRLSENETNNIRASFLLEEGVEVIKILRDSGWNANIAPLNTGVNYYFNFSAGNWQVTTTNAFVDSVFERRFVLENVLRDANDDIVASGGAVDYGTKKVTVYVSWSDSRATTTKSISTYVTNLFE